MPAIHVDKNRENWLRLAYGRLRDLLLPEAPETITIAWSLPSRGGTGRSRRRVIGQCWGGESVRDLDGNLLILISPTIVEGVQILGTLLHEMIHCVVGIESGHRRPFSRLAAHVGFKRPWTQTPMGPELQVRIEALVAEMPPWPGGFLLPQPLAKNRQLKAVCGCDPPRILRVSKRCHEQGRIACGNCRGPFALQLHAGDGRSNDFV